MKMLSQLVAAGLATVLATHAQAQVVAIEHTTIQADGKTRIKNATIVMKSGRITALGKNVRVPPGAVRIDGRNKIVTAGFIDAYTKLGLVEVNLVSSTNEGALPSGPDPIHAAYKVRDGYNPASVAIPVVRSGGVTTVLSVPRGGLVAGQSAVMSLAQGPANRLVLRSPAAMHATLGQGALPSALGSRGLAVERLRELLDDAKQYAQRRSAYERNQTRKFAASRLDLEALGLVVRKRLPLLINVNRASDIRAALRIAREFRISIAIIGGAEAWRLADELARARVPVVIDPSQNLPKSFDQIHVRDDHAKILVSKGVVVVISTLAGYLAPHRLRQAAGVAVAHGMSWADAFAAVTSEPARFLGLRRRGSLKVGHVADVVMWSGDPLELSSRPLRIYIGGKEQSLRTRQTLLFERYNRKKDKS